MANHKSAKKRHRQSLKRRDSNRHVRATCRTALKKSRSALEDGNVGQARELLRNAEKTVASAATKGLYHKNNAARKISRLARLISRAEQASE